MNILCIDDDRSCLHIYKACIEKKLHPIDTLTLLSESTEAIEFLKKQHVDLVITDMMMPKISGIDIINYVKTMPYVCEVVVVTGENSLESAVEAIKLGAWEYLTKPINTVMLDEKINHIRELFTRRKEVEDYRIAKESIEEHAMRTIFDLETRLEMYMDFTRSIKQTLEDTGSCEQKIESIKTLITESEKGM